MTAPRNAASVIRPTISHCSAVSMMAPPSRSNAARRPKMKRPAVLSGTEGQLRGTTLVAATRRPLSAAITGGPGDGYAHQGFAINARRRVRRIGCRLAPPPARCVAPTAPGQSVCSRRRAFGSGRIICPRRVGAASRVFPQARLRTWAGQTNGITPGDRASLPNECGRPVSASNMLRRSFFPLVKRVGAPRVRFHDLRRTAATLMLGESIHPKVVAEMFGHGRISTTLDLYSHVTPTCSSRRRKHSMRC